ncbi:MAG: peptidylprolyl isomerase [bacterium]
MRYFLFLFVATVFISCGNDENKTNDSDILTDDVEVADEINDESVDEIADDVTDETIDEDIVSGPVPTDFVLLKTNKGEITIGLFETEVPNTVANFKQYVTDKFYDGLIFHRIVPGFVIQGGGYDKDLAARETREKIDFEGNSLIKHVKYIISMARSTSINSATSQFFIMLDTFPHLDYTSDEDFMDEEKFPCTAFGIVTEGLEIVDEIAEVETETVGMFEGVPIEPVIIESATLIN